MSRSAAVLVAFGIGCAGHGTAPAPAVTPGLSEPAIVPLAVVPADALELAVSTFQWSCMIRYPNGAESRDLHVPAGRAVRLVLTTRDIEHTVEVEEDLRQRVTPGLATQLAFRFPRAGTYAWKCPTDVPPRQSPDVAARAVVAESPAAFAAFQLRAANLDEEANPRTAAGRIALGRSLYTRKGCVACHTVDGSPRIGPTWQGLWGSQVTLSDGSVRLVDRAYVLASVLTPQAFARAGFPPVMPSFEGQLRQVELDALAAYLESLR